MDDSYRHQPAYVFDNVVATIAAITVEISDIVSQLIDIDAEADQAARNLAVAEATAYLESSGTVAERNAKVELAIGDYRFAEMAARRKQVAAKRRLDYLRHALDAARSISAAKRAEFAAEPTGQWT